VQLVDFQRRKKEAGRQHRLSKVEFVCIICNRQYEAAKGSRILTCSDECHEKLVKILVQKLGEYKKVCSIATGKCYRVPTRTIIEKGLTHEDLVKFPEWKEETI